MTEQPTGRDTTHAHDEGACCGHGVVWHQDTRGCGYTGFSPATKCPCPLMFHEALAAHVAAAVAERDAEIERLRGEMRRVDTELFDGTMTLVAQRDEAERRLGAVAALADEVWRESQRDTTIINHAGIMQHIVLRLRAAIAPVHGAVEGAGAGESDWDFFHRALKARTTHEFKAMVAARFIRRQAFDLSPMRVESVGAGVCNVGPAVGSQWRREQHWHTVWPEGESWCFETETEAVERAVEVRDVWAAHPHLAPPHTPVAVHEQEVRADDILVAHAEGRANHIWRGMCPDETDRSARDPECPVCAALVASTQGVTP